MTLAPPIHADPPDPRPVAIQVADLLVNSGLSGVTLAKLLADRFPHATRRDVYLAAAIAVTDLQAELLIARAEGGVT
jgi:hypothetical protein